jgi:hypothetical protein
MLEEGKIKCRADGVSFVLGKDNVTAIIARFNSTQHILGIILAIAVVLDRAGLCSRW